MDGERHCTYATCDDETCPIHGDYLREVPDLMTELRRSIEKHTKPAPDGDRLPATNSGQETCICGHNPGDHPAFSCWVDECECTHFRPAPQQPLAQEREGEGCPCGRPHDETFPVHQWAGELGDEHCTVCGTTAPPDDVQCFPPSEADSGQKTCGHREAHSLDRVCTYPAGHTPIVNPFADDPDWAEMLAGVYDHGDPVTGAWWNVCSEEGCWCVESEHLRTAAPQQPPAQERDTGCSNLTCYAAHYDDPRHERPAPQQPPAQERPEPGSEEWGEMVAANKAAGWRCGRGLAEGHCDNPEHAREGVHPPSEVDSAGEVARVFAVLKAVNAEHRPRSPHLMDYARAIVAASPGVQGGEVEALHEWPCPNCGATTRARMADHDDGQAQERLAAVLALHRKVDWFEWKDRTEGDPDQSKPLPSFCAECTDDDLVSAVEEGDGLDAAEGGLIYWPCPTVHAAGGGK